MILGRKVRGFEDGLWKREREQLVYTGNHARFIQSAELLEALVATVGTKLVRDDLLAAGVTEARPVS